MEKKTTPQFDLFTQGRASSGEFPHDSPARISAIRKYDKILLLSISFIVTVIVSFSLGVEKGKRMMALKSQAVFDTAMVRKTPPVAERSAPAKGLAVSTGGQISMQAPQQPVSTAAEPAQIEPVSGRDPGQIQTVLPPAGNKGRAFTIQIATFKTRAHALKEMTALKQKGYPVYLTSKGKYTVLTVGNFSDKEAAKPILSKLKKNYQDCFIRRL